MNTRYGGASEGQKVKLRKRVVSLEGQVDAILKSRDFTLLADVLDQLDRAKEELYYYSPDDQPVTKRDCGLV